MNRALAALVLAVAGPLGCGAAHDAPVEAGIAPPAAAAPDPNANAAAPASAAPAPSPPLPSATADVAASPADALPGVDTSAPTLTVTIDKAGAVRVADKRTTNDDALRAAARDAVMKNPNTRAVIAADKNTRHGDVIHVLDLLKQAGITKIAFAVSPSGK